MESMLHSLILCSLKQNIQLVDNRSSSWQVHNCNKVYIHLYGFREYDLRVHNLIKTHMKRSWLQHFVVEDGDALFGNKVSVVPKQKCLIVLGNKVGRIWWTKLIVNLFI